MCPYLSEQIIFPFRDKKYFFCELEARFSKKRKGVEEILRIDQKTLMKLCFQSQEFALVHCDKIEPRVKSLTIP